MRFKKYHALGNDYLVLDPKDAPDIPSTEQLKRICHRRLGLGSDGILYGPIPTQEADFGLRIFNPDGSEAEKSGNGLRIFARYLWECRLVAETPFTILTLGGKVTAQIQEGGETITVDMGVARFDSQAIPVVGKPREVIDERLPVGDQVYPFYAVTIGNPHCVIPLDTISPELARTVGPKVERHPFFPKRTNVQFLEIIDRHQIQIEIWERGAGYTLASGSSSSAAAAVAYCMGACEPSVTVHMPGGDLFIEIGPDNRIQMRGPVTPVADMILI